MKTQNKIIDYLTKHRKGTIPEISRIMGLTPQNIRHHLNLLIQNGLVRKTKITIKQGKGRPIAIYEINHNLQANNLAILSACLLDEVLKRLDDTNRKDLLNSLAQGVLGNSGSIRQSRNLTQRINDSINQLNNLNYYARWEARASGPRIIFGNCPYTEIIKDHPELCEMDQEILQSLLTCEVEQIAQIDQKPKDSPVCIFRLFLSKKMP